MFGRLSEVSTQAAAKKKNKNQKRKKEAAAKSVKAKRLPASCKVFLCGSFSTTKPFRTSFPIRFACSTNLHCYYRGFRDSGSDWIGLDCLTGGWLLALGHTSCCLSRLKMRRPHKSISWGKEGRTFCFRDNWRPVQGGTYNENYRVVWGNERSESKSKAYLQWKEEVC